MGSNKPFNKGFFQPGVLLLTINPFFGKNVIFSTLIPDDPINRRNLLRFARVIITTNFSP
jgi:hypothetical protein